LRGTISRRETRRNRCVLYFPGSKKETQVKLANERRESFIHSKPNQGYRGYRSSSTTDAEEEGWLEKEVEEKNPRQHD